MGNIFKTTHSRVMQLSYSDFSGKSVKNFLSNLHFIMGLGEKVKSKYFERGDSSIYNELDNSFVNFIFVC